MTLSPEQQREYRKRAHLVVRIRLEGLSTRAIGRVLGISHVAVIKILRREHARRLLREDRENAPVTF